MNHTSQRVHLNSRFSDYDSGTQLAEGRLAQALKQLHQLLEEYAPTWYTQQHHENAEAALKILRK